ncbi:MAG TPA: hypothetical protein VNS88_14765 [Nitrospiraceae bacterium]|nr:hypothetical protein [Nitrospiraceae bacterium]
MVQSLILAARGNADRTVKNELRVDRIQEWDGGILDDQEHQNGRIFERFPTG